jgi:hypothetical protein
MVLARKSDSKISIGHEAESSKPRLRTKIFMIKFNPLIISDLPSPLVGSDLTETAVTVG